MAFLAPNFLQVSFYPKVNRQPRMSTWEKSGDPREAGLGPSGAAVERMWNI